MKHKNKQIGIIKIFRQPHGGKMRCGKRGVWDDFTEGLDAIRHQRLGCYKNWRRHQRRLGGIDAKPHPMMHNCLAPWQAHTLIL